MAVPDRAALGFVFASNSNLTVRQCPHKAAIISGVSPSGFVTSRSAPTAISHAVNPGYNSIAALIIKLPSIRHLRFASAFPARTFASHRARSLRHASPPRRIARATRSPLQP
jgi:hypothetical protein